MRAEQVTRFSGPEVLVLGAPLRVRARRGGGRRRDGGSCGARPFQYVGTRCTPDGPFLASFVRRIRSPAAPPPALKEG